MLMLCDIFFLLYDTICYIRSNKLECSAALLGIIGGFFFPSINPFTRVIGAVLWTGGNVLWLAFAKGHRKWALFTLQLIYMVQNVFAIWNISAGGLI
jgi:hypothetical protein